MRTILSIFSFSGRTRRLHYGLFTLAIAPFFFAALVGFVVSVLLIILKVGPHELIEAVRQQMPLETWQQLQTLSLNGLLSVAILSAVALVIVKVASVATCVRRLHDMSISGWAVLPLLLVEALVFFLTTDVRIDLGVFAAVTLALTVWPGTKGANRFGPDTRPAANRLDAVACAA